MEVIANCVVWVGDCRRYTDGCRDVVLTSLHLARTGFLVKKSGQRLKNTSQREAVVLSYFLKHKTD